MQKNVITISRETGSGGHTIGQLLAERLGFKFYDGAIIEEMAKKFGKESGFDGEHMDTGTEFNMLAGFVPFNRYDRKSKVRVDEFEAYQHKLISDIAKEGNCVIVGRNADYILKDNENAFHVFIHADMEHRVKRVMRHEANDGKDDAVIYSGGTAIKLGEENETQVEIRIRQELELKDKTRAAYYSYFTGRDWGKVGNYNLSIDTSIMSKTSACETIIYALNRANGGNENA